MARAGAFPPPWARRALPTPPSDRPCRLRPGEPPHGVGGACPTQASDARRARRSQPGESGAPKDGPTSPSAESYGIRYARSWRLARGWSGGGAAAASHAGGGGGASDIWRWLRLLRQRTSEVRTRHRRARPQDAVRGWSGRRERCIRRSDPLAVPALGLGNRVTPDVCDRLTSPAGSLRNIRVRPLLVVRLLVANRLLHAYLGHDVSGESVEVVASAVRQRPIDRKGAAVREPRELHRPCCPFRGRAIARVRRRSERQVDGLSSRQRRPQSNQCPVRHSLPPFVAIRAIVRGRRDRLNQVVCASGSPRRAASPTQTTYPSGRTSTAPRAVPTRCPRLRGHRAPHHSPGRGRPGAGRGDRCARRRRPSCLASRGGGRGTRRGGRVGARAVGRR